MSAASSAFGGVPSTPGIASSEGGTIVLPDSPQATSSDVGAVWMNEGHGDTKLDTAITVAVTFPKQGLIVTYTRPTLADPLRYIRGAAHSQRSMGARLVWLSGVPAWTIPEPSNGSNWGMIQFVVGGAMIQVDGHTDEASLQAVAQSIVDRATATAAG